MLTRIVKGAAAGSSAAVLLLSAATVSGAVVGPPALDPQSPAPDSGLPPLAPLPPAADPGRVAPAAPVAAGAATASGLRITPLGICLSCTDATAGSGDGRSSATALRVLGNELAGGSSSGTGGHSGALMAAPVNPILSLALAEWVAETRAQGSHSKTALLDLVILPHGHESGGTATVCVVDTESQDTTDTPKRLDQRTADTSEPTDSRDETHRGQSSGDAARADVGNGAMMVALAHSDASSDGMGKAYVAGVGKQELVSSEQSGDEIPIKIPGVDVIAVHHDPSDVPTTKSTVVQADDTAAQPEKPAPIADAVTASAASNRTPTTSSVTSTGQPPATGAAGSSWGLGIPSTGSLLGGGAVLLLLVGAVLTAVSLRRRRA